MRIDNNKSIWDGYNPKAYLKKLVQFEDDKRHLGKDLYPRTLRPDTDKFTKKVWRLRFKALVASIKP
jgi:hypothetical protein